jgi:uncharacterized secreted protein with C-terminal beta-propeller domain
MTKVETLQHNEHIQNIAKAVVICYIVSRVSETERRKSRLPMQCQIRSECFEKNYWAGQSQIKPIKKKYMSQTTGSLKTNPNLWRVEKSFDRIVGLVHCANANHFQRLKMF